MDASEKLYQFLIEDFGFIKAKEKYYPELFGDFIITLSSPEFLLKYRCDRSFLSVEISYTSINPTWFDLALVKALIYETNDLNKITLIDELNFFLRNDYNKIASLFNNKNYASTHMHLRALQDKRFKDAFPNTATQP
jgi:hypothetical protein